jgi:tetratricopeptide (TPR) repeat protein
LRIKEKALGVHYINSANTINNVVNTYDSQGKYDEAIAQHKRALGIKDKAFGVDHINTANTINLGGTYHSQGKYDEAIKQHE